MAENENGMSKKKKVAIITASVVGVVAVLFLAIFLPIYLSQKSEETVESNLPSGSSLNTLLKQKDDYTEADTTVKRIVFDYYDKNESGEYTQTEDGNYTYTENDVNVLGEQEAESYTWNNVQIDVYRISDGDKTTVYFLSTEEIVANEDMEATFYNFTSLEEIVFNNFNTSNVTSMRDVFAGCSSLTTLDVSNFDTSNVTTMQGMFNGCTLLTQLDVSSWNTSNVTIMSSLFKNTGLEELDLSNFDTSNVTNMHGMFYQSSSLTKIVLSSFVTSNVTDMSFMFAGCNSLLSLDITNFDTSNVTNMGYMFYACTELTELDLSSFDTSKVANMSRIFRDCTNLQTIYVGEGWTTDAVEEGEDGKMFDECLSLTNFITNGRVTDKTYAYAGYNEELEKYGYLTDISEKYASDLVGDND